MVIIYFYQYYLEVKQIYYSILRFLLYDHYLKVFHIYFQYFHYLN